MTTPAASPASSPLSRALPYLALCGSITSFCAGTSFAKQLFPVVGAQGTVSYRVGFAALILLAVFRPWRLPLKRADLLATMRYGAVLGLMNFCFYMSLRSIPLGVAIAIEFLGPLTVSLLHARRLAHIGMVAVAAAGLALLLPLRQMNHALDVTGVIFALFSGLFWGLYIIFGKKTGHLPGGQSVSLGMTTAALVVVPIGLHHEGLALFTPSLMGLGLITAVLSSALPYSLEMIALKAIPENRFGILLSVEPAVGALAGMVMLGEHLTALQWLAIALVVVASAGSVLLGEKAPDEAPDFANAVGDPL